MDWHAAPASLPFIANGDAHASSILTAEATPPERSGCGIVGRVHDALVLPGIWDEPVEHQDGYQGQDRRDSGRNPQVLELIRLSRLAARLHTQLLEQERTGIRGDGIPHVVAARQERVHRRLHALRAQVGEDDYLRHPLPLRYDALEYGQSKDEDVVRDAQLHVHARKHQDVERREAREHEVGQDEHGTIPPRTHVALVEEDAEQGADRAGDAHDGVVEELREVWPLRVHLLCVGVEVERGPARRDA
mmetsp:Transcript_2227/g.4977  ORF Transcript_2227/g.4977 Transcript_2227/m.4977 type:complete len:247 (-) Transcript_2227:1069-1809(-)